MVTNGRRATGDGRRAVLFAIRSANVLYRLLDVMPVFAGDDRVSRLFTLVPGSDFDVDALAAIERAGIRTLPWAQARERSFDLILAASPKGGLRQLRGPRVLLPHGAGFNKVIPGEGAVPSGLDPVNLLADGRALASFYALAHPGQLARLAETCPKAAEHAAVVGDPTLDRILASRAHRDHYREALGTGGRRLVVIASTWGPESLLEKRPALVTELATRLPHDAYQLAAIVHPNVRSEIGDFELSERLSPALDAGLILAQPDEEWAALLIAADAVITDHGSAALYAAALDRPVIGARDDNQDDNQDDNEAEKEGELVPGSPMAGLLAASPRLNQAGDLEAAIAGYRPGANLIHAEAAFAEREHALELLQAEVYRLIGLAPPGVPAARPLPPPATPARPVSAFAVKTFTSGTRVRVERFPAHTDAPAHHLAAEYGAASERHVRSAGLLYRRASPAGSAPYPEKQAECPEKHAGKTHTETWTEDEWTASILAAYPACRTAAVIVSPGLCAARTRSGSLLTIRIEPREANGRIVRTDPAAVLSAVHAWLAADPVLPAAITCAIGPQCFQVRLLPAPRT